MSSNSFLVLIVGIVNLIIIRSLGKRVKPSLFLVSFWWSFWLFISTLSLSGVYAPSEHSIFLFITAISSNTIGGILFDSLRSKKKSINILNSYSTKILSRIISICHLTIFLLFPIVLFVFGKSIIFYTTGSYANLGEFRSLAFSELQIFPYPLLDLIYYLFLAPLILTLFMFGLSQFLIYNNKGLLLWSSTLFLLNNLSKAGRFAAYTIVFMLLLIFYYKYFHLKEINKVSFINKFLILFKKNGVILVSVILSILLIFQISFARDSYKNISVFLKEFYDSYIIEYNTIGFAFFDSYLNDKNSTLNNDRFYGRATLGVIERSVGKVLEQITNEEFESKSVQIAEQTALPRELKKGRVYVAFVTIFYPIYQDFGYLGFLFLPLIYGFFITMFSYRFARIPNLINSSYLLILTYLGLFGIYTPIVTWFWTSLLGIPIINFLSSTKLSKLKF
jgi:oligosaccharide repeat unit polymerase